MWSLAWKEVSRRWSRATLAIAGFLLVALLISTGICLGDAIRAATSESLEVTGADFIIMKKVVPCAFAEVKRPKDLGAIPMSAVARIRTLPGVQTVTGSLVVWAFREGQPTVITGVEPGSIKSGPLRQYRSGDRCCVLEQGRLFDPKNASEAVLEKTYASALGVNVDDPVQLGREQFNVVGILKVQDVAVIGGGEAYVNLTTVQNMLGEGAVVTYVYVTTGSDADRAYLEQQINEIVGDGCQVSTRDSLPSQLGRSAALVASGSNAFVVLILVVGGLLIVRSTLSSVRERVTEIGVLRAIGWRKHHIVSLLGIETVIQGMLGAVPGMLLGYALGFAICAHLNVRLPGTFNSYPMCATTLPALELTLIPRISVQGIAFTFLMTVALALVAGIAAGRHAASQSPMDALRQA